MDIHESIRTIPGENGWWNSSGQETFEEIASRLISKGIEEDEVLEILSYAYGAVASQYGD